MDIPSSDLIFVCFVSKSILDKNIQLFDYEAIATDITDSTGKLKKQRLVCQ